MRKRPTITITYPFGIESARQYLAFLLIEACAVTERFKTWQRMPKRIKRRLLDERWPGSILSDRYL